MAIRVKIGENVVDLPERSISDGTAQIPEGAEIEVYRNGEKGYVPYSVENYSKIKNSKNGPYKFSSLSDVAEERRAQEVDTASMRLNIPGTDVGVNIPGAVAQGLPFSELAMAAGGAPGEYLSDVARASPWQYGLTSGISDLVLYAIPALGAAKTATGAAKALLSGAKLLGTKERMLGKAADIASEAVAHTVKMGKGSGFLGRAASKVSNTVGWAAGGAAEATVGAYIDAARDSFVYDTEFMDELRSGLGLRVMLGASIPGLAGAVKDVGAGRQAARWSKAKEASNIIEQRSGELAKAASGVDPDGSITRSYKAVKQPAADGSLEQFAHFGKSLDNVDGAALSISKELNDVSKDVSEISKRASFEGKYDRIKEAINSGDSGFSPPYFVDAIQATSKRIGQIAQSAGLPKKLQSKLERSAERMSFLAFEFAESTGDRGELISNFFKQMDNQKRELDKLVKKNSKSQYYTQLKEAADMLRSNLVDPSLVGKRVAGIQGINDTFSQYLGSASVYGKLLSRGKFVKGSFSTGSQFDPNKIRNVLKKAGDPVTAGSAQDAIDYLISTANFAKEAAKSGIVDANTAGRVVAANMRAAEAFQILASNPVKKPGVISDIVSTAVGAMAGGPFGAVAGKYLGKPVIAAGKALAREAIERTAEAQALQGAKNIRQLFKGINPGMAWQVASFGPENDSRKPEEISGRLQDQDKMAEGHPSGDPEDALKSLDKASALQGFSPQEKEPTLGDLINKSLPKMSDGEARKFKGDAVRIAEFPMFITYLAATGRLRKEHVDIMKAIHPTALARIQENTRAMATMGFSMNYKQKQQLSILLGEDVDESVSKKTASAMRNAYSTNAQSQTPTTMPARMTRELANRSKQMQSSVQQLEAGR